MVLAAKLKNWWTVPSYGNMLIQKQTLPVKGENSDGWKG
jgi:hypothetical protein